MIIRGSKPRSFPVGVEHSRSTLLRVYGSGYEEGVVYTVPEGEELVIPEHDGWVSPRETLHVFPAGTRFRLVHIGDLWQLSITEILPTG